jgi:hypothetical protein
MKNKTIFLLLLVLGSFQLYAQDSKFRLSVRFAPNIASNRVIDENESDGLDFKSNGLGVRFSAGLNGDFYFGKNYSFYSGVWYSVFRTGLQYTGSGIFAGNSGKSIFNIQQVQVPVAIKLFTNEVATDMKLYLVIGGTLGLKIKEKQVEWETTSNQNTTFSAIKPRKGKATSFGDVGLLLGAGLEYQLGDATAAFGGISYNRGLLNTASDNGPIGINPGTGTQDSNKYYTLGASLLSLEIGLKF